jgi:polar amino acid transport system substrate-binding protein
MTIRTTIRAVLAGSAALTAAVFIAASAASAADMIGNCELTGTKGETPFTPAVAGQLTVEVNLPSPGWWNGDTPDTIKERL